jgi:hypothetical protein
MVEMLVVIAIFGIVTTILLFNLPTFRNQNSLDLVAQEVAITIRGAQVFGGGGRVGVDTGDPPTYGIYIDQDKTQFDLFRDLNDDGYDNPGGAICADECVERYALSGGFGINAINCFDNNGTAGVCDGSVQIMFTRPNLEPNFRVGEDIDPNISQIDIVIKSLRDQKTKSVFVWSNGQIATGVSEAE